MNKNANRVWSILLVLVMIISMLPVSACAGNDVPVMGIDPAVENMDGSEENSALQGGAHDFQLRWAEDETYAPYDGNLYRATLKTSVKAVYDNPTNIVYRGEDFTIRLLDDQNETPLQNVDVTINMNGVDYTRTTDDEGLVKLNINMAPGEYTITVTYDGDETHYPFNKAYTIDVRSRVRMVKESSSLIYSKQGTNGGAFKVRLLDDADGTPVKNVDVAFVLNALSYTRQTNDEGVAQLNINLSPGTYPIMAEYGEAKITDTLDVRSRVRVVTHDLAKAYGSPDKFKVYLLDDVDETPVVGQKVTFNINGVNYHEYSDNDGVATRNINLMFGEYMVITSVNGFNWSNRIIVSELSRPPQIGYTVSAGASPAVGGQVSGDGTVAAGQSVTLAATQNEGYRFVGWMKNGVQVSADNSYTFTPTGNVTLTAVFEEKPAYCAVKTAFAPRSLFGNIELAGAGTYTEGSEVTLTASPTSPENLTFLGWVDNASNALISRDLSYRFTVHKDVNLTAVFASCTLVYPVTAACNPANGGTVTGGGDYTEGQRVTVTATPNEGYAFSYWTGAGMSPVYEASYTFDVADNVFLTAHFAKEVKLTVTADPAGGGTVTGGGFYAAGSSATVTATANDGYVFTGWYEGDKLKSYDTSYVVGINSDDKTVTARFLRVQVNVIDEYDEPADSDLYTVEMACNNGVYFAYGNFSGAIVRVTITHDNSLIITRLEGVYSDFTGNAAYRDFVDGAGNQENYQDVSQGRQYDFTMPDDPSTPVTITAKLERWSSDPVESVKVTVKADPDEGGTVTGGGTVTPGTDVTVEAAANPGYVFDAWYEGTIEKSKDASYTFKPGGNIILTAKFIHVISSVAVPVTAPAKGAAPQSTIAETDLYTGTITWMPNDSSFAAGTAYTARVELSAKAGHKFAFDAAATVDGADTVDCVISQDGSGMIIDAAFPKVSGKTDVGVIVAESEVTMTCHEQYCIVVTTDPEGLEVTYIQNNDDVVSLDENGIVTALNVGDTTITVTHESDMFFGYATIIVRVNPRPITEKDFTALPTETRTYNGKAQTQAVESTLLKAGIDYDVVYTGNINVGTASYIVTGKGNYTGTIKRSFTINKADAPAFADENFSMKYNSARNIYNLALAAKPADGQNVIYALGRMTTTGSGSANASLNTSGKLTVSLFSFIAADVGKTITIPVTFKSDNYADAAFNVVITLTEKNVPTISASDITVTYTRNPVADSRIQGLAFFDGLDVPGAWAFKFGETVTYVAHSGTKTVVFTPNDSANYATVETTLTLTINKADPTVSGVSVTLPATVYDTTAIDDIVLGFTDDPGGGSIKLDDSQTLTVGTKGYNWTYTPKDTDNYNTVTGTVSITVEAKTNPPQPNTSPKTGDESNLALYASLMLLAVAAVVVLLPYRRKRKIKK